MQDSAAESYAHLIRDRVAEIPAPPQFRAPDVLIGEGCGVWVSPPTKSRPKAVLTVGERLAVEGPRKVVQALVSVELASVHLDTAERRAAERAGSWAPGLIKFSGVVLVLGLVFGGVWFMFFGGLGLMAGMLGLRSRLVGAEALREHIYAADELAASWMGRQAVVEGLRWIAEHVEEALPHPFVVRFAAPTIQDRLAHLGA